MLSEDPTIRTDTFSRFAFIASLVVFKMLLAQAQAQME